MNFKTKSASIVAAVALGLTMSAGIASAQNSTTSATLDPVSGATGCTLALSGGTSINFGTFVWNGSNAYTGTASDGTLNVLVNTDSTPGERDCPNVLVSGTALMNGATAAFPVGAIGVGPVAALNTAPTTQQVIAANADVAANGVTTPLTVSLDESQVNNTAPTGSYSGTITFELGSGL